MDEQEKSFIVQQLLISLAVLSLIILFAVSASGEQSANVTDQLQVSLPRA
jgi:competence protein ComGC